MEIECAILIRPWPARSEISSIVNPHRLVRVIKKDIYKIKPIINILVFKFMYSKPLLLTKNKR